MESLAKRLLNNPGLRALTVLDERLELLSVGRLPYKPQEGTYVKLQRSYNQEVGKEALERFWRVVGPANHPNCGSDLSIAGLKQWRIIK